MMTYNIYNAETLVFLGSIMANGKAEAKKKFRRRLQKGYETMRLIVEVSLM